MKEIKLTNSDKVVLVDDDMFDELDKHYWRLGGSGYAMRGIYNRGDYTSIYMHAAINSTPAGLFTDHINQNKLDNQKSNLRSVNAQLSNRNKPLQKRNITGMRGVSYVKRDKLFTAKLTRNKKPIYIGQFKTFDQAKEAFISYVSCHFPGEYI